MKRMTLERAKSLAAQGGVWWLRGCRPCDGCDEARHAARLMNAARRRAERRAGHALRWEKADGGMVLVERKP